MFISFFQLTKITFPHGEERLVFLIQFYNNDFRETFPEGTILKLFSAEDLNEIYYHLSAQSNSEEV